jgi:hypothetical protein
MSSRIFREVVVTIHEPKSSLPQWLCGERVICVHLRSIVGASLLAMAACQAAWMLAAMASSRERLLSSTGAVCTQAQESDCWSDERWGRVLWRRLFIDVFNGVLKQWVGV